MNLSGRTRAWAAHDPKITLTSKAAERLGFRARLLLDRR